MRAVKNIVVLPGDGIGPEVTASAIRVLKAVESQLECRVQLSYHAIGGDAIDKAGKPFPQETKEACLAADAVLLGAVGGPKWDGLPGSHRPETGLLQLRQTLGTYANIRPATIFPGLAESSPLRSDIVTRGFDIQIIRELTGGIYFGDKGTKRRHTEELAFDEKAYSVEEVRRIAHIAFQTAEKRKKRVVSVDKANVLESSKLWRRTMEEVAAAYPAVEVSHMYVDNAAMQLILHPDTFDVIVTSNMFGDILSDEAAALTGSIGLLPSAALGDGGVGLYEPVHGSAPDIAGKGMANPVAAVLSLAMLLRHSLQHDPLATRIERAVMTTLKEGARTLDMAVDKSNVASTSEMTERIIEALGLM